MFNSPTPEIESKPKGKKRKTCTNIMSRIAKEYKNIVKTLSNDNDEDTYKNSIVLLEPYSVSDLSHWHAIIRGPINTPYYNHDFPLEITLPSDYPMVPPCVKFKARSIPHCNVNFKSGEICLDILTKEHWSPVWDLLHVMHAIGQLLSDPVPESPIDIDIANILKADDQSAYNGLIKYYLNS